MSRCVLCPDKHTCVPADGPECDYLFLGEAPGGDENRKGKPFVGKTGREVNEHYLPLAGLRRDTVRIDNAISCFPDRPKGKLDPKRKADIDLLFSCAEHHLYPYLDRVRPKLIIPMGSFACKAIDPDIDLELQHGMPVSTSFGTAFPMYHPALGIHSPKQMLNIRTDWIRLRKYIAGKLRLPEDSYAGQEHYEHVQTAERVREILHASPDSVLACDTESTRAGVPFCITFSNQAGTGYLIRTEDRQLLSALQEELDRWTGLILFHNWLYDGSVVAKMGLKYPRRLIRDTMEYAFILGNLPQGLKALSYRELGMKMQDFDDLVTPHSAPLVMEYYRQAYAEEWPTPEPELKRQEGGGYKMYKPQNLHTKLKRFFSDYDKKQGDKDPFEMWTKNWEDSQSMVEERIGHWPGKCISHVPFDEVIHYACRDADSTLRLWPLLSYMQRQVRITSQERWADGYLP